MCIFHGILILISFVRCSIPSVGGVSLSCLECSIWKSPLLWYKYVIAQGKWIFLGGSFPERKLTNSSYSPITEVPLFTITLISLTFKYLVGFYADLFILMHVLTLWVTVKSFVLQLKMNNRSSLESILSNTTSGGNVIHKKKLHASNDHEIIFEHYESLRTLACLINSALGGCVLPYMGEWMFSTAVNLNLSLIKTNFIIQCFALVFYVIAFLNLILSAEICRMVSKRLNFLYLSFQAYNKVCWILYRLI